MANLTQQPNEWNVAYVPNVFTVSDLGTADQFYLAVEINGSIVTSFRQPANPSGVAHFDVSKVLQSYLEPSFYEETTFVSETPKETLSYRVQFGTITGGVIDVGLGYSLFKYVINGYDNWRTLNWDDALYNPNASQILCDSVGSTARYSEYNFLTNYPKDAYPLRSNTYHTLSFFNRMENWADGTAWDGTVIQPAFGVIKYYTSNGALIQTSIYSINETKGLGPRLDYNSNTQNSYTDDQIIGTIGVGPQNLKDAGLWPNGGTSPQIWNLVVQQWNNNTNIWNLGGSGAALVDYYTVDIYSIDQCYWNDNGAPSDEQASTLQNYLGDVIYSYRFNIEEPCTAFEVVTLSFVNQYGVKDYFQFDRRNNRTVTSNRSMYSQSNGTWSSTSFNINQHSGGKRVFSTDVETEMVLSTNWMSDSESKWLEELYTSPNVQVYVDGNWEPCVINSNMYEQKTYARDKMFQHTINVIFANDKKVQRG